MDEFTALFSRKDMTFEEAVAYFKERVPVTASRFYQIAAEYRTLAFTVSGYTKAQVLKFLSTPSARRATAKTETKSLFSYKLYNILHEFRRALIYNGSKNYPNHAK